MDVKIERLINSSILNSEWIGFSGDSEYEDENGELQLGYWNFIGITEDTNEETPFDLTDEIPEEALKGDFLIPIKNNKDHICVVKVTGYGDLNEQN